MMNAAAPDGTPPRRIRDLNNIRNLHAPPCPGGALRRVTIINIYDFPEHG